MFATSIIYLLFFTLSVQGLSISREQNKEAEPGGTVRYWIIVQNDEATALDIRYEINDTFNVDPRSGQFSLNQAEDRRFSITIEVASSASEEHTTNVSIYKKRSNDPFDTYSREFTEPLVTTILPISEKDYPSISPGIAVILIILVTGISIYMLERKRYLTKFFLISYWRLSKDHILTNETRNVVYESIKKSDGIGLSEVARMTNRNVWTVRYALDVLVSFDLVKKSPNRLYYPVDVKISPLTKRQQEIQSIIANHRKPIRQMEILRKISITKGALINQLKKLETNGHISRMKEGKAVFYEAIDIQVDNESSKNFR